MTVARSVKRLLCVISAISICGSSGVCNDITTSTGVTYHEATVTGVEPDGLRITHGFGVVKIPFEDLPESLRVQFHYDKERADRYRIEQSRQQVLQRSEPPAPKRAASASKRTEPSPTPITATGPKFGFTVDQSKAALSSNGDVIEEGVDHGYPILRVTKNRITTIYAFYNNRLVLVILGHQGPFTQPEIKKLQDEYGDGQTWRLVGLDHYLRRDGEVRMVRWGVSQSGSDRINVFTHSAPDEITHPETWQTFGGRAK